MDTQDGEREVSETTQSDDETETMNVEESTDDEVVVDELEARFEQLSDQYVRLQADFDNFRRRTRENEAVVREQAAANLVRDLLPVIDNLQLALSKVSESESTGGGFVEGVELIEQQLLAVLGNHGLLALETKGQPFDPHVMEAVTQVDGQGQVEPGHVLEELRRGYTLHDKVLRAAQVVVAQMG